MRLHSLKLTNFRSHRETELALAPLTLVRGPNNSGKSSLALALEWALTGRCALTDAGGRGADALIAQGARQMAVTLDLEVKGGEAGGHRWLLTRSLSRAGGQLILTDGGASMAGKAAQAWLEERLAPAEVLTATLQAGRFLALRPAEQKAMLAATLGADPLELPPEIRQAMTAAGAPSLKTHVHSVAEVELLYKMFYQQRTEVGRARREFAPLAAPEIPADMPALAAVRAGLEDLQRQLGQVQRKHAALTEANAQAGRQYAAAVEQIAELEGQVLSDDALKAVEKAIRSAPKWRALEEKFAAARARIHALRSTLLALQEMGEAPCPTCTRPLPAEEKAALIGRLGTEHSAALDEEAAIAEKQRALGDPAEAERMLAAHRAALPRLAAAEQAQHVGLADTSALDEEIARLQERIRAGQEVLSRVAALDAQQRAYKQASARAARLEAEHQALEQLVAYFGPNGARAAMVSGRLPAFTQRLNAALERFGYVCDFELEPYRLEVAARPPGPEWDTSGPLALLQLSESEAFRFSVAFQLALAEATGIALVVVDRADLLQPSNRRLLTALLSESEAQALVLATAEGEATPEPIPGVAFYGLARANGASHIAYHTPAVPQETAYAAAE